MILHKGGHKTWSLVNSNGLDLAQIFPMSPGEKNKKKISGRIGEGVRDGSKWLLRSGVHFPTRRFHLVPRDDYNEVLSKHWWSSQGLLLILRHHHPPLYWFCFLPSSRQPVTVLCNFTCRYLTPCLKRLSPMPSCTCLGRRAVTPSPRPAVRGPWRSSMPRSRQRNVSPALRASMIHQGHLLPPLPPAAQGPHLCPLCGPLPFASLRTVLHCALQGATAV